MKNKWRVFLMVPYSDMETWDKINKLANSVDPHWDGAGSGCGYRDMDWTKETKIEATTLAENLKKTFVDMKAEILVEADNG